MNSFLFSKTSSNFEGRFADLPGVKLFYIDSGGPGTPIVLLHANTGTVESWKYQIESFSNAGFRVIAFDRRGWGNSKSNPSTGAQPGSVAEDLDKLVAYLDLPSFHLLGIAGGGFVALDYAAWRHKNIRCLVIAASNGQFTDPDMLEFYERIAVPGLTGNSNLRPYLEVGVSYRSENPAGFTEFVQMAHKARQKDAEAQSMRTPNTLMKISSIQSKTLILSGGADLLAPPALMQFWSKHLKHVEYFNIEDGGHSLNWERPEQFNFQVIRFLNCFD